MLLITVNLLDGLQTLTAGFIFGLQFKKKKQQKKPSKSVVLASCVFFFLKFILTVNVILIYLCF